MTIPINFPLNRGALYLTPADVYYNLNYQEINLDDYIPHKLIFVWNQNSDNTVNRGFSKQIMEYYKSVRGDDITIVDVPVDLPFNNAYYNEDGELVDGWSNYIYKPSGFTSEQKSNYVNTKIYQPVMNKISEMEWSLSEPYYVVFSSDIPFEFWEFATNGIFSSWLHVGYLGKNIVGRKVYNHQLYNSPINNLLFNQILTLKEKISLLKMIDDKLINSIIMYTTHLTGNNLDEVKRMINKSKLADNGIPNETPKIQVTLDDNWYRDIGGLGLYKMFPVNPPFFRSDTAPNFMLNKSNFNNAGLDIVIQPNSTTEANTVYTGLGVNNIIHFSHSLYMKKADKRRYGLYANITGVRDGDVESFDDNYIYPQLRGATPTIYTGNRTYKVTKINNHTIQWNISEMPASPIVLRGYIKCLVIRGEDNTDEFDLPNISPFIGESGSTTINVAFLEDGTELTANDFDCDISGDKCKIVWFDSDNPKRPAGNYNIAGTNRMQDLKYFNSLSYANGGVHFQLWSGSAQPASMQSWNKYFKDTGNTLWSQIDRENGATCAIGFTSEPWGCNPVRDFVVYYLSGIPFAVAMAWAERYWGPMIYVGDPMCNPFKDSPVEFYDGFYDTLLPLPEGRKKGTWYTGRRNVINE